MKDSNFKLAAVFLLSAAIIAYELTVMRSFSVGSWSNFGSMVISIALLGFGLAGTFLTFVQKWVNKNPDRWLAVSALILPIGMTIAHILAQQIPFNPVLIATEPIQLWWIGAYYLVYAIPFVCGAIFIGVAFIALSSRIHELYFWNMFGSGIGGFLILGCMYLFPPDSLNIPVVIITFIAAIGCYITWNPEKKGYQIKLLYLVIGVIGLVFSIFMIVQFGKIKVSDFKSVSYIRKYPEYKLENYSYSPLGEMHLYSSSYLHFAPGLSDNAAYDLKELPKNAFMGLYIDGGGPIGVMKKISTEAEGYIDYLPMSAPYQILNKPDVLMIRLGGGIGVFTALHHNAGKVVSIESNPDIINLLSNVKVVTDFNGNLLKDPRVQVLPGEPRAYCMSNQNRFDLAELSLIDSVGLSQTGGYPVNENFTYTAEGITDYMRSLKPEGILSITVWNKLSPPRNVLRLLASITDSLKKQGVKTPENRIYCFQLLLQTATVLIKNSDFTQDEIDKLNNFSTRMSFDICYFPGMPEKNKDFDKLLAEYTKIYTGTQSVDQASDIKKSGGTEDGGLLALLDKYSGGNKEEELRPADLYHFALKWMLSGKTNQLFDKYIFDIRPATDERPYYTAYLKPHTIPLFLKQLNSISEEWGYIMLLGTLVQSIIFGLLIVLMPIIGKRKELFSKRKGTAGVILYYACLGLGYMLVEIFLIQRLVFFLEDPIISLSLVITSMLVISGLGSLFSHKLGATKQRRVQVAVVGISLALIFYIFGLSPIVNGLSGLPVFVKGIISILLIAPSAFFLGIPFPTGMSALSDNRKGLLPWAWGMNGALSVTGSVLAKLLSVTFGFTLVLVISIIIYIIVALIYRSNEVPDEIVVKSAT